MTREDKWMWYFWWPLSAGGLVGFGALGPNDVCHLSWGNMLAGGVCVVMAILWGVVLGLQIRRSVQDSLMKWGVGAQLLYDQEALKHEETADRLFDLAYGTIDAAQAKEYLTDLDGWPDYETEDDPNLESH